jgi:hypothetical protein
MTVLCEEKGHQLRVYGLVVAEVSAEETADEVSVYRSVVAWEMDIFERTEKVFKIGFEFFYLGGFACSIQSFEYYKHDVCFGLVYKYRKRFLHSLRSVEMT